VLIVTPGPDMGVVARNALLHGRGAALSTALGIVAGLLLWTAASVAGRRYAGVLLVGLGLRLATSSR
jgi:threonine/homoserine/homoserine lactone efflux protein